MTMKSIVELRVGDVVRLNGKGPRFKVVRIHPFESIDDPKYLEFDSGKRFYFGLPGDPELETEEWEIVEDEREA